MQLSTFYETHNAKCYINVLKIILATLFLYYKDKVLMYVSSILALCNFCIGFQSLSSHCGNDNALIKCFECLTVAWSFDVKCTCF